MAQKRPAKNRIDKYTKKVDPETIGRRYEDTKELAVNKQKVYFTKAEKLESVVKSIMWDVTSIYHHYYIAYAEELVKKTTNEERDIIYSKWLSRGLDASKLSLISEALLPTTDFAPPPTLKRYEYYVAGDTSNVGMRGLYQYGQTFTLGTVGPNENFNLSYVKLKLWKVGNPGTLTVSLKNVDVNQKPTGPDLAVGTIDGNSLTTVSPGLWYQINMSSYTLQSSIQYAIVCKAPSGDTGNRVYWRYDSTAASYAGGRLVSSSDGGLTWSTYVNYDTMFEIWGLGPQP